MVRASDRVAVAHFAVPATAPGSVQSVDWDGTIAGVAQPEGRYVFQVAAAIAGGVGARAAQAGAPAPRRESFWLVHDVFPIAGPHTYGQGFGAQRSGHVHEGQDVMADCGLPLVATQAGTVKFAGSQALAGNYVVISAADGSADYVYMHLRDPALVHKGDAVVHRPADRLRRAHRRRHRVPSALRAVAGARAGTRAGRRSIRCRA